jgi:hypothetical protein
VVDGVAQHASEFTPEEAWIGVFYSPCTVKQTRITCSGHIKYLRQIRAVANPLLAPNKRTRLWNKRILAIIINPKKATRLPSRATFYLPVLTGTQQPTKKHLSFSSTQIYGEF